MPSLSPQTCDTADHGRHLVVDAPSRWLDDAEDLMLGFECANPMLQIERWGQETGLQTWAL